VPTADCEALGGGWLLQPINAWSSLVFVAAGVVVFLAGHRNPRATFVRAGFGVVLISVGIGSFAFHGPGGQPAGWAHDASLTALFLLVLAVEAGAVRRWAPGLVAGGWLVAVGMLAVLEAGVPDLADTLNAVLVVPAVGMVLWRVQRTRRPDADRGAAGGLALLTVGAVIMLLSRTGGPLCAPDSLWQGHALWHILAATGIGLYATRLTALVPLRKSF
jgi:hypothetical protein